MTPEEIVTKFANEFKKIEPIYGQPSDINITRFWEVVEPLLLQILNEKTGGTHNFIGFIRILASYTTRYGAGFVEPTIVGAYDATINNDATAIVRARTEATHKSNRANCGTYETVRQETAQFVVVKDTWV